MLHQETCIQAKLFNDVFGQESYPTAKWRPCWGSGFFLLPAPDGNAVSSVSLRPLDRTAVCCTQAERCTDTPPAGGTCASFLEVSICASDLSPLQRKLIRLDAPPFKAPLLWSILSLKLQQQKKKNVLILLFFFQTTSFDVKITFYPV